MLLRCPVTGSRAPGLCVGWVVGVSVRVPACMGWEGQGLLPLPRLLPGVSQPARLQHPQRAPGRCFGVTSCSESCSPCMVTKGTFWETPGGFAAFSLFRIDFLPRCGAGWASPGGSAAEIPVLSECPETPQPSARHHQRGFGPEHHQLLVWKDPEASLKLKHAPASSWSFEPSRSRRCPGDISNAVRKRVANSNAEVSQDVRRVRAFLRTAWRDTPFLWKLFIPKLPDRWMPELPISWITNGNSSQPVWDTPVSAGCQHGGISSIPS